MLEKELNMWKIPVNLKGRNIILQDLVVIWQ